MGNTIEAGDRRSSSDVERRRATSESSDSDSDESRRRKSGSSSSERSYMRMYRDEDDIAFEAFDPKAWYDHDDSSKDDDLSSLGRREEDEGSAPGSGNSKDKYGKAQLLRVFSAKYTGSAELFGDHSASLKAIHDPKGQRQPLFKWLHIRQDIMDFDEFWLTTSRYLHFSEEEARAIANLKARVKKQCVRSITNAHGSKVGYLEPRHVEVPLQSREGRSKPSQDDVKARWICLPFFSLRTYSGLLSASDPTLFPNQTLLQTVYSRNTKERDMEQAVCQLGTSPQGECFHVEQAWILVLGNNLLVTCGAMDRSALENEVLDLVMEPSRQLPDTEKPGTFCVNYGDSTMWLLSTEECPTWFSFLRQFHEVWPSLIKVRHKGQTVDETNWIETLNMAKRRPSALKLDLTIESNTIRQARGVLKPPLVTEDGQRHIGEFLHVLTLLPSDPKTRTSNAMSEILSSQLEEADKYLCRKTPSEFQAAYKKSKTATRQAVYAGLAEVVEQEKLDNDRRRLDTRVDAFNAADDLFQFFFPASFNGPMAGKFWGAIEALIQPGQRRQKCVTWMGLSEDLVLVIRNFQSVFSHVREQERAKIRLPREFLTAWLYILSATIDCVVSGDDRKAHFAKSKEQMKVSMQEIVQGISKTSLRERAIMLPIEVASLISLRLLKDQVAKSDDITETYTQYLNSLDIDITTNPSEKPYQQLLNLVQQELTGIRGVLAKQRQIIESLRSKLKAMDCADNILYNVAERRLMHTRQYRNAPQPYHSRAYDQAYNRHSHAEDEPQSHYPPYPSHYPQPPRRIGPMATYGGSDDGNIVINNQDLIQSLDSATQLSALDRGGFRALFVMECAQLISQREIDFQRSSEFATDLERSVVLKMNWVRDRQENAIFAFTLVTIIFLPLSSVASIFGMNTSDVRDMPFSQWLYWAVAIPVTAVVIVGGLWWMNELGNVVGWFTGKRARRSNARYAGIVSPQALDGWTPIRPNRGEEDIAYAPEYPTFNAGMAAQSRRDDYAPLYSTSAMPYPMPRRRTRYV